MTDRQTDSSKELLEIIVDYCTQDEHTEVLITVSIVDAVSKLHCDPKNMTLDFYP